jgi:hypothetical protein
VEEGALALSVVVKFLKAEAQFFLLKKLTLIIKKKEKAGGFLVRSL